MDFTMSFLDDYVSEALEAGATPYKPPMCRAAKQKILGTVFKTILIMTYNFHSISLQMKTM